MTDRVKLQLEILRARKYRNERVTGGFDAKYYECIAPEKRKAVFFCDMIGKQKPLFIGDDLFGFNQYFIPTDYEMPFPHSGNVTIDYEGFLEGGITGLRARIAAKYGSADGTALEFYDSLYEMLDKVEIIVEAYRNAAKERGNTKLSLALSRVPAVGATNYYEALLSVKILQYILRINFNSHITLGRFDKYMKPYFERSLAMGASEAELLELTELFFISLNFDSDTYLGMQQGDNGQSLVLGGCDAEGESFWCSLSEICLTTSEELMLIDPKIHVRVNQRTPLEFYERCTRLTKQGLGFPQYSNDDAVIPGLVKMGYELTDARDYTVAACWEFIIPRYGADIPNIEDLNYPLVIERVTERALLPSKSFDDFKAAVRAGITERCDEIIEEQSKPLCNHDPLLSAFILPCIERGRTLFEGGAKYCNMGAHGAGLSTAADAMTAIELGVFSGEIKKEELLAALKADFIGCEALRQKLLSYPKMGNDDDAADKNGGFLLDCYADGFKGKPCRNGGIWRAGTGSALSYILSAAIVGATADGRRAYAPYASSFSPSLDAKVTAPTSAVMSFTKFDISGVMNGGPFTIEIHDSVFKNPENERKVAVLVKSFIDRGGHEIQINSIRRETLLAAQKNPEQYKNLIVRVWGWSGYFVELDKVYQDHVIKRTEFTV